MSFASFSYLIAIVALIALIVRVYYWLKDNILSKEKVKAQEEYIEAITKSAEKGKKNEKDVSELSDDELINRLSK